MTEAGPLDLISDEEIDSDTEKSLIPLPGVRKGNVASYVLLSNGCYCGWWLTIPYFL